MNSLALLTVCISYRLYHPAIIFLKWYFVRLKKDRGSGCSRPERCNVQQECSWRRTLPYSHWEDNPQTGIIIPKKFSYCWKSSRATEVILTWGSGKGMDNPQGIWRWRPVGLNYRILQDWGNTLSQWYLRDGSVYSVMLKRNGDTTKKAGINRTIVESLQTTVTTTNVTTICHNPSFYICANKSQWNRLGIARNHSAREINDDISAT